MLVVGLYRHDVGVELAVEVRALRDGFEARGPHRDFPWGAFGIHQLVVDEPNNIANAALMTGS